MKPERRKANIPHLPNKSFANKKNSEFQVPEGVAQRYGLERRKSIKDV